MGGFFLYHALNAYYGWSPIPRGSLRFEKFIQTLLALGPLMSLVKATEGVAGTALLVSGLQGALGSPLIPLDIAYYALVGLAPLVAVIVTAQVFLNFRKGYRIALWTLIPFVLLVVVSFMAGR